MHAHRDINDVLLLLLFPRDLELEQEPGDDSVLDGGEVGLGIGPAAQGSAMEAPAAPAAPPDPPPPSPQPPPSPPPPPQSEPARTAGGGTGRFRRRALRALPPEPRRAKEPRQPRNGDCRLRPGNLRQRCTLSRVETARVGLGSHHEVVQWNNTG